MNYIIISINTWRTDGMVKQLYYSVKDVNIECINKTLCISQWSQADLIGLKQLVYEWLLYHLDKDFKLYFDESSITGEDPREYDASCIH